MTTLETLIASRDGYMFPCNSAARAKLHASIPRLLAFLARRIWRKGTAHGARLTPSTGCYMSHHFMNLKTPLHSLSFGFTSDMSRGTSFLFHYWENFPSLLLPDRRYL